jgi:hypothetical protein
MEFFSLVPHPSAPSPPAIDIYAVALMQGGGRVSFRYRVRGEVSRIRLPEATKNARTDGLWRHTCFEVFVAPKDASSYVELNFATSTAWAAYTFENYRFGMKPLATLKPPAITFKSETDVLVFDVSMQMRLLTLDSRLGFSAVIEDLDGQVSHWALAHPAAKADFHDANGWSAAVQRPTAEKLG